MGAVATVFLTVFIPRMLPTGNPCVDNSRFRGEDDIIDGTVMTPNKDFNKEWRLLNPKAPGICDWTEGYNAVWVGGDLLASEPSFDIPKTKPSEELKVNIPMLAPPTPDRYKSIWQLRSPKGTLFGDRFWVDIVVK